MVRTLDFHSNNAGSNPAGSRITYKLFKSKSSENVLSSLRYEFFFTSLLPLLRNKARLRYERPGNTLTNKIFLKKSYLIFLWLNYLASYQSDICSVKVTKIQSKTKLYTVVKAPMAHKTNSKEQFLSKHYCFKIQFTIKRKAAGYVPNTTRRTLNTDPVKAFPVFETNLLFLTSSKTCTPLRLVDYFQR